MSLLVRRINRAKWESILAVDSSTRCSLIEWFNSLFKRAVDVSADAITNCLKTNGNDLSVWSIETEDDVENAILALITGSSQTRLSTLHIVIIDERIAVKKGIKLVSTPGDTVAKGLVDSHKDLSNLTYSKLGIIKDLIVDSISQRKTRLYTRAQLREVVRKALANGQVNKLDLNPELVTAEKL